MDSQPPRKITYSHSARRVFGVLADKPAYEVVVYLDELACSPTMGAPIQDAWTILPSGARLAYRLTPDGVHVQNIVPP